ncbi:MAG: hypothetical protein A2131_01215 [Candidatus Sungbacteria bacterium GWC2_49_10]|uniref:Uncharacterized protein n=2 Tax=Parcubacteria group TaxID=1794811 RepID=A0A0G1WLD5_9BACT|nr:MAG: hypothetical protein UY61_C0057G0002 [Candidatus Adlerbacteria bacterium GW2011_GWC1_50_9]OGZ94314.1 MAG: hypothetical protein A2131_01215 [Candidatus Sungbacteria bacterium GWC2_49_10]
MVKFFLVALSVLVIMYGFVLLVIGVVGSKSGVVAALIMAVVWFALGGIAALATYLVPFLQEEKRKSFEASKERIRKSCIKMGHDPSGLMDRLTMSYEYQDIVLSGPFGLLSVLLRVLFGKSGR